MRTRTNGKQGVCGRGHDESQDRANWITGTGDNDADQGQSRFVLRRPKGNEHRTQHESSDNLTINMWMGLVYILE